GRFLTETARFDGIPRLMGGMKYAKPEAREFTLAMLQEMVPNQGDGWKMTLEELSRYYEHCSTSQAKPDFLEEDGGSPMELSANEIPASAREVIGIYLDAASRLGTRTAQLHLALSTMTEKPEFQPEDLTHEDLEALANGLRDHAGRVFEALKASLP